MCCFSAPTEVHGTTIFARRTAPDRQALVYKMHYESKTPVAMILPLPVAQPAGESSVSWKSLKDYPDFFTDLASGFPNEMRSGMKGVTAAADAPPSQLAVHEVGDYIASFVPRMDDFDRVDPRFAISKEVWRAIPEYADYGFAVFQLKDMVGSTHPIAFEFRTRLASGLYFPTVHIHDGTVHAQDQFDHVLYLQDSAFDESAGSYGGPSHHDPSTGWVRSKNEVGSFVDTNKSLGLVASAQLLHKATMIGLLPNNDVFVDTKTLPMRSQGGCGRCDASGGDVSAAPMIAIAGLSWIIQRRQMLRRK